MNVTLSLLEGFAVTFKIFILTLALALPLGLIISFGSMTKLRPVRWLVRTFIWIIRGTPLMLQLIVIYYGPGLIGSWAADFAGNPVLSWFATWKVPEKFFAVIVAFVINYACYFSEIYRGGIEAVSKGQYEAGQVLGLTKSQIFKKIVLKQVIKRILPPMGNEVITLVKDTSLANVLTVGEIIYQSKLLMAEALIWPMFYAGVFYLIFVGLLTILLGKLEKKLSYFKA